MACLDYGKKNNQFYKIIKKMVKFKSEGSFELDQSYFKEHISNLPNFYTDEFVKALGKPREKGQNFTKRNFDIAAAMQQVFEEICSHMLKFLYRKTHVKNLVLAGGSFMNSVFNGKAHKLTPFNNVWISSCPADDGLSIGAALYLYNNILQKKTRYELKHNFLGPNYSSDKIKKVLIKYKVKFKYEKNITQIISQELARGKLVGWFQGRMEFGPRALGARSIIGDPRSPTMQKNLNLKVKYRESFRPFAPSVIREDLSDWFEMDCDSPYMLFVSDVATNKRRSMTKDEKALFGINKLNVKKSEIPAVTHVDYSARVQTVHKETNSKYYKLLSEFKKKTGCPVLVNTSFNVRGEPIVNTPEDAFNCFMGT